ncbi:MAG: hypothetical protein Q4G27_00825 [Flavobacteriaceae bacterium]|nr:hypothetical protein [Flavobacteriaceae bacterium]
MKKISIFLIVFALISCKKESGESITSKRLEVSDNEIINYLEYCNDRFEICIEYPSNFSAQPEPANGDGRTFVNRIDSAEIILYGFMDLDNEGLEGQMSIINEMIDVSSLEKSPNGLDIKGIDNETGRIHYEKVRIKTDSTAGLNKDGTPINIIYSLQFVHPKSKEKKFRDYWSRIHSRFK